MLSVVGGVHVDSKTPVMTSSTRGFACSAFKILIGVGFAYVCSYRCPSCKKIGLLYASIFFNNNNLLVCATEIIGYDFSKEIFEIVRITCGKIAAP